MTRAIRDDNTGLLAPLIADGLPFLTLGSLGLLFAGGFAIFLAAVGQFLPEDVQFLGMTAQQLCSQDACRIVHFMYHDRVSFGGTLIALSILYLWLIHFPLRDRRPWAWWTLLLSNLAGFSSFLTYLGFGYLDTWHGLATLLLLLVTAFAMAVAGLTITIVGMTVVFVPQDLAYMGTTREQLMSLNSHLIPLIAHDRAGFGGGVFNVGFIILCATWCATPSRHLWQALAIAGAVGFGCAIGVHPIVGYNNPVHLAPACLAAVCYAIAIWLAPVKGAASYWFLLFCVAGW